MENKYEEIEKWKALKDSGDISEEEFEIEKQKILNAKVNTTKSKNKIAKIFFILTAILMVITIVCIILLVIQSMDTSIDLSKELELDTSKSMAEFYKSRNNEFKYKLEIEKIQEIEAELKKEQFTASVISYSPFISGGITIIFLIIAVIFKVKEKGGIKIVD